MLACRSGAWGMAAMDAWDLDPLCPAALCHDTGLTSV